MPWHCPLDPCNQKCLLWIGRPRKPPVISNRILAISHRYAFIAILVPKLVAMVTPLCPLCTVVSQMNSPIARTLSQNQTLHGYVAYTWSYGHFCDFFGIFWPKFGCHGNVPWSLGIRNVFFGLVDYENPVVSNHILTISHRNAFICIYSNFSPKIGNAPLSLVYGSVTDEFPDGTKPNSACICCIQLKLWPFFLHFGLFWPKFGCHGNVL